MRASSKQIRFFAVLHVLANMGTAACSVDVEVDDRAKEHSERGEYVRFRGEIGRFARGKVLYGGNAGDINAIADRALSLLDKVPVQVFETGERTSDDGERLIIRKNLRWHEALIYEVKRDEASAVKSSSVRVSLGGTYVALDYSVDEHGLTRFQASLLDVDTIWRAVQRTAAAEEKLGQRHTWVTYPMPGKKGVGRGYDTSVFYSVPPEREWGFVDADAFHRELSERDALAFALPRLGNLVFADQHLQGLGWSSEMLASLDRLVWEPQPKTELSWKAQQGELEYKIEVEPKDPSGSELSQQEPRFSRYAINLYVNVLNEPTTRRFEMEIDDGSVLVSDEGLWGRVLKGVRLQSLFFDLPRIPLRFQVYSGHSVREFSLNHTSMAAWP